MDKVYDENTLNKLLKLKQKADKLHSISPLFYRENICVENCAGCCMKFSLVYWGWRWEKFKLLHPNEVYKFKKKQLLGKDVWVNEQEHNKDYFCEYLDKSNGRCKLHFTQKPLHCEMEPITFSDGYLTKRPFKEAHLMRVLDGYGAKCYMTEINGQINRNEINLLIELNDLLKSKNLEKIIKELNNER